MFVIVLVFVLLFVFGFGYVLYCLVIVLMVWFVEVYDVMCIGNLMCCFDLCCCDEFGMFEMGFNWMVDELIELVLCV